MTGMGTIVNAIAIIVGASIGLVCKRGIPEKWQETIVSVMALSVLVIGIKMALTGEDIVVSIMALVLGSMIGEWLDIDGALQRFGLWVGEKMTSGKDATKAGKIAEGFVTATLIYCVGAMAIVGSLEDGLRGEPGILYAKATLDGIMAIIFTANMGFGVMLSAVSVSIYQGVITLLAESLQPIMSAPVLNQITAVGGIAITALAVTMLKLKEIRVANTLPAIIVAIVLIIVKGWL